MDVKHHVYLLCRFKRHSTWKPVSITFDDEQSDLLYYDGPNENLPNLKQRKNEVEWTGKAEIRAWEILAVGKGSTVIFWPTAGFEKRTFDNSGFSAKET